MKHKNKVIFLILLIIFSICSCEMPPCEEPDGVQVNIGFYHFDGKALNDILIDSLNIYLRNDSTTHFFDGTKNKTGSVSLPLSMVTDSSTFIFKFGSSATDTLTFRYTQNLKLVSYQCGFVNFFNITNYKTTSNQIDSLWIRKDLVEYGKKENVKIYF